jgi:hypothetical protein
MPERQKTFGETKLELLSRERCHGVLRMLMSLEHDSHVKGFSINPFGGAKAQKAMQRLQEFGQSVGTVLASSLGGPDVVLKMIDDRIYCEEAITKKERGLVGVPKTITKGLAQIIAAQQTLFDGITPNILVRGQLLNHITRVMDSDEFLINQSVPLESLSTVRLVEACNDRCIGTLGRSDEELRQQLSSWLQHAVLEPKKRTQTTREHYNGNLARAALMCYYAMDAVRDDRSSSYLPRMLLKSGIAPSDE